MQRYSNDYSSSITSTDIEYSHDNTRIKHTFSKFDNDDLFHEENNIKEKVIRVKRISSNKNERWNIFENNKIIFVLDGTKISKKEKEYLRTTEGFKFLIAQGKTGIKSLLSLRKNLKKLLVK
jgi:hypothetical protein